MRRRHQSRPPDLVPVISFGFQAPLVLTRPTPWRTAWISTASVRSRSGSQSLLTTTIGNSLCSFKDTASFVNSEPVPAIKRKYGNRYAGVALQQPNLEDNGSGIIFRFHESSNAPHETNDVALENDRCTMKVKTIWDLPFSAVRDDTSRWQLGVSM